MEYYLTLGGLFIFILGIPLMQILIIKTLESHDFERFNKITKGQHNFYTKDFLVFLLSLRDEPDTLLKRMKVINFVGMIIGVVFLIGVLVF